MVGIARLDRLIIISSESFNRGSGRGFTIIIVIVFRELWFFIIIVKGSRDSGRDMCWGSRERRGREAHS